MSAGRAGEMARVGGFALLDPVDHSALRWESPATLRGDGSRRWPVVEGIPFLRTGREELREQVVAALDAEEMIHALALLLGDQDDFARIPPPTVAERRSLIESLGRTGGTLREAMAGLHYGPVADYFAHRWSAPTYLSGLALLDRFGVPGATVVETACGIGHYLRDLSLRGVASLGLDVVFSKLWLARRFLVPKVVGLVCADAVRGWPLGPAETSRPTVAFCHDAFYFLPDKPGVVRSWQTLVGDSGRVLIGHAHNREFDHRGVAGEPWSPAEYATLLPGAALFDDAELARSAWAEEPPLPRDPAVLTGVEAVALAWDAAGPVRVNDDGLGLLDSAPGRPLRLNPMLKVAGDRFEPDWPSPRFAAEYADQAPYLTGEPAEPAPGSVPDDVARLARRRILLDLPEHW